MVNLGTPVHVSFMFLDSGRKACSHTRWTCELYKLEAAACDATATHSAALIGLSDVNIDMWNCMCMKWRRKDHNSLLGLNYRFNNGSFPTIPWFFFPFKVCRHYFHVSTGSTFWDDHNYSCPCWWTHCKISWCVFGQLNKTTRTAGKRTRLCHEKTFVFCWTHFMLHRNDIERKQIISQHCFMLRASCLLEVEIPVSDSQLDSGSSHESSHSWAPPPLSTHPRSVVGITLI